MNMKRDEQCEKQIPYAEYRTAIEYNNPAAIVIHILNLTAETMLNIYVYMQSTNRKNTNKSDVTDT